MRMWKTAEGRGSRDSGEESDLMGQLYPKRIYLQRI
jgi:hypothetical protein